MLVDPFCGNFFLFDVDFFQVALQLDRGASSRMGPVNKRPQEDGDEAELRDQSLLLGILAQSPWSTLVSVSAGGEKCSSKDCRVLSFLVGEDTVKNITQNNNHG